MKSQTIAQLLAENAAIRAALKAAQIATAAAYGLPSTEPKK